MQEMQAMSEQGQPDDPRIAVAQMNLEAKKMDIEARREAQQMEAQLAQMDMQTKRENTAYQIERERSESEQAMLDRQFERELALAKMEQDGVMTREEMARRERLELLKIDNERQLFSAEAAIKARQGSGI